MPLTIRWLGAAGLELIYDGTVLLVDPFFSRPSVFDLLLQRPLISDEALAARHIPRADWVLVTHPHYDHLMDVPGLLRRTGAVAFGSPNTAALLRHSGVSPHQVHVTGAGERFSTGPFTVEVFTGSHTRTPIDRWINGPLPGRLAGKKHLRALDYHMDACYSYRIAAGEHSLLVGAPVGDRDQSVLADILFLYPYAVQQQPEQLLARVQPQKIVLIHWDDFLRSAELPLLPMRVTRAQGLERRWPPVGRLNLSALERTVSVLAPGAEFVIPVPFSVIPPVYFANHPQK